MQDIIHTIIKFHVAGSGIFLLHLTRITQLQLYQEL